MGEDRMEYKTEYEVVTKSTEEDRPTGVVFKYRITLEEEQLLPADRKEFKANMGINKGKLEIKIE